ncbi:MAG: ABC transporter permease [Treponema sp.]|jgi:lipoprotein-releasing system permease protein|nr:ABC transporter permease [Treponema sp.]
MKNAWIGFVAARYVSRGRRNSPSPVFSVLGIATGVLALTVIIAVMNGFQLGFIESILEISSGHIRVENFPSGETGADLQNTIRALPEVVSALPFIETSALIRGRLTGSRGAVIRGVPNDALEQDPGLARKLDIEDGSFDLDAPDSIVLGAELAKYLAVRAGDKVTLLSISRGAFGSENDGDEAGSFQYTVTGVFRCGFYEYDLGWAFINIDRAEALVNREEWVEKPVLEIKLRNRWQDRQGGERVRWFLDRSPLPQDEPPRVISWRDYNRAFFGALRTEKLMMFILVGLIFIVVGLNIFQAQRRVVLERREEIGLLRALGASETAVRLVFVWDGFIIGLAGAALGLLLGLLIAFHIPGFFSFLEQLVNFFIRCANAFMGLLGSDPGAGEFAVFSPQVFYIKEIPSRVVPHEVVLIVLFGFLSALLAAWFASGKASKTKPAEVLRYE